jgi:hypothetical protein
LKNLYKEIGGWPLIDDHWNGSKYDWINALIVMNKKLISNEVKLFLKISVASDIRNISRSVIQVNYNNNILLNIIIYLFYFLKIFHPFAKPKHVINGIFTNPENLKPTSSNFNNTFLPLKKIAQLLKGSPIDIKELNVTTTAIESLEQALNEIVSEVDPYRPVITVKELIATYKGIDWMRLLNGIFRDTNIDIKPEDLVQVPDHQYLLQLSNVIRNQTNK